MESVNGQICIWASFGKYCYMQSNRSQWSFKNNSLLPHSGPALSVFVIVDDDPWAGGLVFLNWQNKIIYSIHIILCSIILFPCATNLTKNTNVDTHAYIHTIHISMDISFMSFPLFPHNNYIYNNIITCTKIKLFCGFQALFFLGNIYIYIYIYILSLKMKKSEYNCVQSSIDNVDMIRGKRSRRSKYQLKCQSQY